MNYSLGVKHELISGAPRGDCCRLAYARGLFFDMAQTRDRALVLTLSSALAREEAARVFRELYHQEPLMNGNRLFFLSEEFYKDLTGDLPQMICPQCAKHFLRGLMISCGSVTDPKKAYHLELRISDAELLPFLSEFLIDKGWHFSCRKTEKGVGLYTKNSTVIEEFLTLTGANQALFELMDAKIAREIRNAENRATNCVLRNLEKTVGAADRACRAINGLLAVSALEKLPIELQETARLRITHPDVSLAELATLHNPPITKSGLNHRLQKIIGFAAEVLEKQQNKPKGT